MSRSTKPLPRSAKSKNNLKRPKSRDPLAEIPFLVLQPVAKRRKLTVDDWDPLASPPPFDREAALRNYYASSSLTFSSGGIPVSSPPGKPEDRSSPEVVPLSNPSKQAERNSSLSPAPSDGSSLTSLSSDRSPSLTPSLDLRNEVELYNLPDNDGLSEDEVLPDINDIFNECKRLPSTPCRYKLEDERPQKAFHPTILRSDMEPGSTCLVLRKDVYIPAVMEEYTPAMDMRERATLGDRCTVEDFEGRVHPNRKRSGKKQVIFRNDEEIATCSRAKCEITESKRSPSTALTRARTPEETTDNLTSFADLDLATQIRHIRPHLHSILNDDYAPAAWRNDLFFGSRMDRARLAGLGLQSGGIGEEEIADCYLPELERWALRAGKKGSQSQSRRPMGSARYEKLTMAQKSQYIKDVLLPETLIRFRIILDGLSGDDNQTYNTARELLDEMAEKDFDWEIRLRDLKHWRREMREKLGLPKEDLNQEERKKEAEKGKEQGWAGGRMRKAVKYR